MWEAIGGLLVASAISGVVPLVNAELLVVGTAAALPAAGIPLIAAVSAVGQMTAKTLLFELARRAPSRLPARARTAIEDASTSVRRRGGTAWSLVFTSAATGLPPFYGVSVASGALGVRRADFVCAGGLGRFLRFGALAWLGATVGG
jgi:membrane protein YqaA with SNARE-associated domain